MNARDGMRRLREERRKYHLCLKCGCRLGKDYKRKTCPKCLDRARASCATKSCNLEKRNAEDNSGRTS
jgi:hypothetical protein